MHGKLLEQLTAGRVDVKADRNGRICFIEVNPLAGLHPVHSDLPILSNMIGIKYQALIEMIMHSAIKRHQTKSMMKKKCCILFNQPGDGALPDELDVLDQVEYIE